ncbi:helix-turn-helix domain-containing protein [Microbacterium sp. NPDC091662]|uniref:helix-turn-helix domain-containing protein n=1 Tax=Microbacterium sp. NPDC091662 TaxID=3364211 RepID=UPI00381B6163
MVNPTRGVLYPARLPQFHRLPAPSSVTDLVAWFWIPEWDIAPGRSSRQEVVAYPALNLVVDADAVTLSGATTRLSHRDLRGSGWAVGALLRPAAVAALIDEPGSLVDDERVLDEGADVAHLRRSVAVAMGSGEGHRPRAVEAFSRWLGQRVGPVGDPARQANAAVEVLMGDGAALTPEEAATRLAVSVRTLQRMTHRHVGLSPGAMIRRRRLQEAAQRVREEPGADLASIAAELGYADHAHLTRDFQAVLGVAPRVYRSETRR